MLFEVRLIEIKAYYLFRRGKNDKLKKSPKIKFLD